LLEETLPEQAPAPFEDEERALIWAELRHLQSWWRSAGDDRERRAIAEDFSALVHHLHGGREPLFYRERLEILGVRDPDGD
jgi:hypothetical protein